LKRCQSLLPVNDLPHDHMPSWGLFLIQDHRTEEMIRGFFPSLKSFRELAFDVFPKRYPLLFLVPDILTLKEWYLKTLFGVEYRE
jgi:hypothetical protein